MTKDLLQYPCTVFRWVYLQVLLRIRAHQPCFSLGIPWSGIRSQRFMCIFQGMYHISPVLAWEFLGPESDLKDLCVYTLQKK